MVLNTLPQWSYSEAAVQALALEMQSDPRVVVVGEDVGRGGIFGQYKGLQAQFGPQRVIDTPISEAAIMGGGVGMALAGLRPVVVMRVVDFALCAMDEIVNQAAKNRYMFGGQGRVPLVARMPMGVLSAQMAWDEFRYDETSPAIGVPKWWYSVWLPIFCGVVCTRALQRFKRLRGHA